MTESMAWQALIRELDMWHEAAATATFWWRDDDATEHTTQLEQLDQLSRKHKARVSIAVIPARLQASLIDYMNGLHHFDILQHGYAHQSHAPEGVKKIEIGGQRDNSDISDELKQGLDVLREAFPQQFIAVLVPPWNRIEARCFSAIRESGFTGLSSMWARNEAYPAAGLLQVNTHLDPVNWRHDRGFIDHSTAIVQLQMHLRGRRIGFLDADEPTGILTHHLDQTESVWQFCDELFGIIGEHPAAAWTDAASIWG